MWIFTKVFWLVAIAGAIVGGVMGVGGVVFAKSSPQEAASAAMGCLIAIAPYCLARSVDGLLRRPKD